MSRVRRREPTGVSASRSLCMTFITQPTRFLPCNAQRLPARSPPRHTALYRGHTGSAAPGYSPDFGRHGGDGIVPQIPPSGRGGSHADMEGGPAAERLMPETEDVRNRDPDQTRTSLETRWDDTLSVLQRRRAASLSPI